MKSDTCGEKCGNEKEMAHCMRCPFVDSKRQCVKRVGSGIGKKSMDAIGRTFF